MLRRDFLRIVAVAWAAAGCGSTGDTSTNSGAFTSPSAPAVNGFLGRVSSQDFFLFDSSGTPFVIRTKQGKVERLNAQGASLWTTGPSGIGAQDLNTPVGLDSDLQQRVWVVDRALARLVRFSAQGVFQGVFSQGLLGMPQDIKFFDGSLYVSDALNARIAILNLDGALTGEIRSPELSYPRALAFDSRGRLHVVNSGSWPLLVFSPQGQLLGRYGRGARDTIDPKGQLAYALDIWIRNNVGQVAIADPVRAVIQFFDLDGNSISNLVVPGIQPRRLSFAPSGELFVFGDPL